MSVANMHLQSYHINITTDNGFLLDKKHKLYMIVVLPRWHAGSRWKTWFGGDMQQDTNAGENVFKTTLH